MQFGVPESRQEPTPRDHAATNGPPVDAVDAHVIAADFVGGRKRVLDLGCGRGELARLLLRQECDVVGFDINPSAVEEARRYCTHVGVADLDTEPLETLLGDQKFDVVVLSDVLQYLRNPIRLLDAARDLLLDGGYVVAVIPNAAHGAVRLAAVEGQFPLLDDSGRDGRAHPYTLKTVDELFLSAGYRTDDLSRTIRPVFDSGSNGTLQRKHFDAALVVEVESGPEVSTYQFVIRAAPLTTDAKHRAIAKRFISANTELSTLAMRLERRERDIVIAQRRTEALEGELNEARSGLARANEEARKATEGLAEVTESSRANVSLRSRVSELEQRTQTAETRRREAEIRATELLERAHNAEVEAARFGERLAARESFGTPAQQIATPDDTLVARRDALLLENSDLRASLEAERSSVAAQLEEARDKNAAILLGLRKASEETEYAYARRVADLTGDLDQSREALAGLQSRFVQAEASAQARVHDAELELETLRSAQEEARGLLNTIVTERDLLKGHLSTAVAEFEKLRGRFAAIKDERDAGHRAVNGARDELTQAKERVAELQAELSALGDAAKTAEDRSTAAAADLAAAQRSLAANGAERESLKASLGEAHEALARVGGERDRLKELVSNSRTEADMLRTALDSAETRVQELAANLERGQMTLAVIEDERDALKGFLSTARSQLDEARAALSTVQSERDDLKAHLTRSRADLAAARDAAEASSEERKLLASNAEGLRVAAETLSTELEAAKSANVALVADSQRLERDRVTLQRQVRDLEDILEFVHDDLAIATRDAATYAELLQLADIEISDYRGQIHFLGEAVRADAEGHRAAIEEREAASARLQEMIASLALELSQERDSRTEAVAELNRARQHLNTQEAIFQEKIAEWKDKLDMAGQRTEQMERAFQDSRSDGDALRAKIEAEVRRSSELERTVGDQVRAAIDQTRAEAERTALLIDTVQSSVFWKIKRWFHFFARHSA